MNTSKPAPPLPLDSGGDGDGDADADGGLLEREGSAGEEDEDEDENAGFATGKASPVRQTATDPYASLDAAFSEYAVDAPQPGGAGQDAGLLF
jgi:hypothetical protein